MENTKTISTFSLINGMFNPADAAPLISNLYNAKIEFHNRQLLKENDSAEKNLLQEEERITQLQISRKNFQLKMKEAIELGCDVQIKGVIEVSFIEK